MLKDKKLRYDTRSRPTRSHYRLKRPALRRLSLVFGTLCVLHFVRLHLLSRSSLEAKYTPTKFNDTETQLDQYHTSSDTLSALERNKLLAARPKWQPLGSGCEGSTFTWNGNVIKTFKPERSPFRNCLAPSVSRHRIFNESDDFGHTRRWPTEIPASLFTGAEPGFLRVKAFFFASSSPRQEAQWHLVMPLMEGGTLQHLAQHALQGQPEGKTSVKDLDIRYRGRFNEVLSALRSLHARGFCHDDVKTDNVFIGPSTPEADGSWLLGDLGNVREVSHPYHTSRMWTLSNKQLRDCRANDAMRAVKTYLQFLREASMPGRSSRSNDFDIALLDARESWARLLWRADAAGNTLAIDKVLEWSFEADHPETPADLVSTPRRKAMARLGKWLLRPFIGLKGVYDRQVTSVLKISASEGPTRKLALTWLLGVPVGRC